MAIIYKKSEGLTDAEMHYCPGCHHVIIHKLVAETLVETGLLREAVGICLVGCSVPAYNYLNCDMIETGAPVRMAELLATLDGCSYAERVCVTDIAQLTKAKRAIKKAFELQMQGKGFTFVEVLSTCPTNWGMSPVKAVEWLKESMTAYYPLGVIKDTSADFYN